MFTNLKRILMAEADAATGAAAAVPATAPAAPVDVPQAQGAPVITKEVADVIASTVAKAVADVRDSIFAEARRTFTQKKTATKEETTTTAQPAQPDPIRLRSLDRALSKHGVAPRLTDAQYRRVEQAFASESPDDADSWVKDYFDGWGAAQAAPTSNPQPQQQQAASQAAPKPGNEHPVSDRGAPPASKVPLTEQPLISMSKSDRDALIREKGVKWYWAQLSNQLKGVPVSFK